jgi:hypothetical protein
MKFYSDVPNLHIIRQRLVGNRTEHFELCVFNDKGELETEDKEIIRQLINIYRHEETKQEEKVFKCKHCDFETTNKGELAAHYKALHPKPKNPKPKE